MISKVLAKNFNFAFSCHNLGNIYIKSLNMNIALIGSGGREDALCRKLKESKKINQIFCIPGNAGTAKIATNLNVDFLNFKLLLKIIKEYKIKMVIVGPEEPLVKA